MVKSMWKSDHHIHMWLFPIKFEAQLHKLNALEIYFPLTTTKGPTPNLFQHDNTLVHNAQP